MLGKMVSIVRRAGDMIRDVHHPEDVTREKNGPADLVTQYDESVQAFLRQELLALLPEAGFLGEEGDHEELTQEWVFIVDPIDGTTNFVRNLHNSGISVALARGEQVEIGVVYNPFTDEMFYARRGQGAFCDGQPLQVSGNDPDHSVVMFGSTLYDDELTDDFFRMMRLLYDRCLDFRRFGSAALDLCYIAAGRVEIYCECRLRPWDYAAGSLILQEAGGCVTQLDGSPLSMRKPSSVFATNGLCHSLRTELMQ
ncbi:MAG: inositol monophosphatase [Ruminococcaceae bacterium]|nr:inositol monophosphatase [Oscillospiraceae bacterium]